MTAYYDADGITLYHGDCREVLRGVAPESADMVLTDPPYLVSYRGRWGSEWGMIEGDSDPSWIIPAFAEIWRILKQDSLCLSFYGWPSADTFLTAWKLIGFRPVSQIVCTKNVWGLGYFTRSQHEPAYLLAKGNPRKPDAAIGDVFPWDRESAPVHPNQKPLGTISKLIATYSDHDALIVDPFAGSGTTLVAARNLGRRAIGVEIDGQYCDAAVARLSQQILDFDQPAPPAVQQPLPIE